MMLCMLIVSKDLDKRTVSGKVFKDRDDDIALNPQYHEYQRELVSTVYKIFDKKLGSVVDVNEVPAQESHKTVIKNLKKRESVFQV